MPEETQWETPLQVHDWTVEKSPTLPRWPKPLRPDGVTLKSVSPCPEAWPSCEHPFYSSCTLTGLPWLVFRWNSARAATPGCKQRISRTCTGVTTTTETVLHKNNAPATRWLVDREE